MCVFGIPGHVIIESCRAFQAHHVGAMEAGALISRSKTENDNVLYLSTIPSKDCIASVFFFLLVVRVPLVNGLAGTLWYARIGAVCITCPT